MSHRHVVRLLDDYVDGALSQRDASRVEDHVAVCAECRRTLAELRSTVGLLHGLRGPADSPDVADQIVGRIRRGEADPSRWERLRARASGFLAGPLGAPLATAAVGLLLIAVLPRVEVEIRIPGSMVPTAAAPEPSTARVQPQRRAPSAPLLARRVNESLSQDPSRAPRSMLFACLESSSVEPCRDQHAFMTRLAMDNVWAFLAEIEQVPEPRRDIWLHGLSRYAADTGDAAGVAARLRATGDPRAQQLAVQFEQVR